MKILAIDCATTACSVAVWADGVLRAVERADLARGQAEALMPMVERVRAQSGLAFAALDRLAAAETCNGYWHGAAGFERVPALTH